MKQPAITAPDKTLLPGPRRLQINAVLAATQVVVGAAVLFVLFRFIVRVLGTEAIGLWSLVMAVTAAIRLGELGLGAGSIRFVPKQLARGAVQEAAAAASTATLSVAAFVLALCVIVWPFLYWVLGLFVHSAGQLADAHALMPYALASLWLAAVSNSITTALVGCHRADLSSLVGMTGQFLWLAAALLLVPHMGLEGLALGQVIQYLVTTVAGWLLLGRELRGSGLWMPTWSRKRFMEMWRYGVTQQFISMAALLGEPLAKMLMARFGNLSLLGVFEMANRLVSQVRMLLVSANQVLVPHYAGLAETADDALSRAYIQNVRMITVASSILFSFLAAGLPVIGLLWLGRDEPGFWIFALLMCFGWYVNLLAVPGFFFNAGIGRLGTNLAHQLVQSAVMLLAGAVAGSLWGAVGAALAWPIGLTAGTALILTAHTRRERVTVRHTFGSTSAAAALVAGAVSAGGLCIYLLLLPRHGLLLVSAATVGVGLAGWVCFFAFAPQARRLMREFSIFPPPTTHADRPTQL